MNQYMVLVIVQVYFKMHSQQNIKFRYVYAYVLDNCLDFDAG
jgi:hypothetical protein